MLRTSDNAVRAVQELLPAKLEKLVEMWSMHAAHALSTVRAVNEASAVETDARTKHETAESYVPDSLLQATAHDTTYSDNSHSFQFFGRKRTPVSIEQLKSVPAGCKQC